eukprot:SAG31_NODE_10160_length_1176_cov_1.387187_1_plen_220_part_01
MRLKYDFGTDLSDTAIAVTLRALAQLVGNFFPRPDEAAMVPLPPCRIGMFNPNDRLADSLRELTGLDVRRHRISSPGTPSIPHIHIPPDCSGLVIRSVTGAMRSDKWEEFLTVANRLMRQDGKMLTGPHGENPTAIFTGLPIGSEAYFVMEGFFEQNWEYGGSPYSRLVNEETAQRLRNTEMVIATRVWGNDGPIGGRGSHRVLTPTNAEEMARHQEAVY